MTAENQPKTSVATNTGRRPRAGLRVAGRILATLVLAAGPVSVLAQEQVCKDGTQLNDAQIQKGMACAPDFSQSGKTDMGNDDRRGNTSPPTGKPSSVNPSAPTKKSSSDLTILPKDRLYQPDSQHHESGEWSLPAKTLQLASIFIVEAAGALLGLLLGCGSIVVLSNTVLASRPLADQPRFRFGPRWQFVDPRVTGVTASAALGRRLISSAEYSQLRDQFVPQSELCFGLILPILLLIFSWAATFHSSVRDGYLITIPAISTAALVIAGIDRRHKFQSEVRQFIAGRARREEAKRRLAKLRKKAAKRSKDKQTDEGRRET
jgi:hypothetical protein